MTFQFRNTGFDKLFPKANNFANFIFSNDCARPWFVYVKTFLIAFIGLVIVEQIPDLNDLERDYGDKLVGGKGFGKKTGRREGPAQRGRGELTARELKFSKYKAGLGTILRVTQPLETIGFLWMLWSVGDEFFAQWQGLLMRAGPCMDISKGPEQRDAVPHQTPLTIAGASFALVELTHHHTGIVSSPISASVPAGRYTVVAGASIIAPSNGLNNVFLQLRTTFATGPSIKPMDGVSIPPNTAGRLGGFWQFDIVVGGSIGWEIAGETVPIGVFLEDAFIAICPAE